MTIEELKEHGFVFAASHYGYYVSLVDHVTHTHYRTIASVLYRLPDSQAAMLERARRTALIYFMAERLSA